MNNASIKRGGIDTIVAFIVVLIPLTYILALMIGIIYHFSVQNYVAQVAKELAISAGTHGKITAPMKERVETRLNNLGEGSFQVAIKIQHYNEELNIFETDFTYDGTNYVALASLPNITTLNKRDVITIFLRSEDPSLLATIASFGMFDGGAGGGGMSGLRYTAFREEVVRNGAD